MCHGRPPAFRVDLRRETGRQDSGFRIQDSVGRQRQDDDGTATVGCLLLPRFHAEVEAEKLELHGEPLAVHHRGRLLSASVEAEDMGLRIGMRLTQARAVCFVAEYVAYIEDRYEPHWKRVLDICKDHVKTIER